MGREIPHQLSDMSDDVTFCESQFLSDVFETKVARGEEVHVTVETGTNGTNGTAQKLRLLRGLSTELPLPKGGRTIWSCAAACSS